jgi:hypothetical protein
MSVENLAQAKAAEETSDILEGLLHYQLFTEAERVRWRMEDIPWSSIDRSKVTPHLLALVRQITLAELTTYAATRRFLQEFSDDIDFTQWMSVWFYEETKHPQVLMRWLAHFGETFDSGFVHRGRATAPFMKSRFGTLVTNVISELVASASYRALQRHSTEPVLADIAKHLAADEARHAASFYAFARRMMERSPDPVSLQRDGLKVLYMWFVENDRVQHPVNEFHGREQQSADGAATDTAMSVGVDAVHDRAFRMIGTLLGLCIERADDIRIHLNELRTCTEGPRAST